MKKYIWLLAIVSAFYNSNSVYAQITFSPYTINGIGDLAGDSFSNSFGMGQIGIGTPKYWHVNNQNPANLVYNNFSMFQMGAAGENRRIETNSTSEKNGSGGIKYIAFAFPIKVNKWTTSLGIMPYSTVNYNINSSTTVEGTTVPLKYNFIGSGGITKVYFANGFSLSKGFSVGFSASYLFGLVESETVTNLGEGVLVAPFPTAIFEKINYSGFKFKGAVSYRHILNETSFLNFGAIYETKADLDGSRFLRLERKSTGDLAIPGDTLAIDQSGTFNAPSQIGIGLSWEKLNKFTVGLDFKINQWTNNPEFGNQAGEYVNTAFIGLGLEFVPDYTNVSSYFKRIRYRIGANYEETPYLVQNKKLNDFGINFGWSLPVGVSNLDMGFKYGQRGTVSDNLIRERYFKFVLGATINDRWFVRRKYD